MILKDLKLKSYFFQVVSFELNTSFIKMKCVRTNKLTSKNFNIDSAIIEHISTQIRKAQYQNLAKGLVLL